MRRTTGEQGEREMSSWRAPPSRSLMAAPRRLAIVVLVIMLAVQFSGAPCAYAEPEQLAAGESTVIRVLPGSPFYALKRAWEQVRLFFTWKAADKAVYLADLIRLRTAEMMAVSRAGNGDLAAALARDQERLIRQAEKALGKLKDAAESLSIFERVEQAASAAMRNFSEAARQLPESAREGVDDVGRKLGQGVQRLIGQLDDIRATPAQDPGQDEGDGNNGGTKGKPTK